MTPFTPNEINPDFLLFTCDNRDEPDVYNYKYKLKDGSNRTSRFSAGRKSKFIVHGYMDHYSLWNQVNFLKFINLIFFIFLTYY